MCSGEQSVGLKCYSGCISAEILRDTVTTATARLPIHGNVSLRLELFESPTYHED